VFLVFWVVCLFLYVKPSFFRRLESAASLTGRENLSISPFRVVSGCFSIFCEDFFHGLWGDFWFFSLFLGLGSTFPVVRYCCHTRLTVCL